jgi:predicted GNAT family N-acyltransferase
MSYLIWYGSVILDLSVLLDERRLEKERKKDKSEEYTINGFILCQHEGLSPSIFISLVCVSTPYKGAGAKLLSSVIDYSKNNPEILEITLYALPELQLYYQKNQFDTISTLRLKSGEIKVHRMARKL